MPRLFGGPTHAFAGTWIGAEAPAFGDQQNSPFIQVGVNEVRLAGANGPRNAYFAFWSDTQRGFHPSVLFQVRPGDQIYLGMSLADGRWSITASDVSDGHRKVFSTPQEAHAPFNLASWTQEDVTDGRTAEQLPYPALGRVRFTQLEVNGGPPPARALKPTWMSTPNTRIFGPTAALANAFAIRRLRPSAEVLRYQHLVVALDEPAYAFNAALDTFTPRTSAPKIRRTCERFLRALNQSIARLRADRWSSNISGLIKRLIAATQRTRRATLRLARTPPGRILQGRLDFLQHAGDQHGISLQIKARLHMPVTTLANAAVAKYVRTHGG